MRLRIAEIFGPTVQGEGILIGEPTVFVRASGCDFRCSWCDSQHAVDKAYRQSWAHLTPEDVWAEVERLSGGQPLTVSISGGNPALQDFAPLIALGQDKGYRFACETQGSTPRSWFADLDTLVLSPKPPSSGQGIDKKAFNACLLAASGINRMILKIVIADEADYAWAKSIAAEYPDLPLYLQPCNPEVDPDVPVDLNAMSDRLRWLVEKTMTDGWFAPRILPQLHVLIWGNQRGV